MSINLYELQVSFLLCESVFCFVVGFITRFNAIADRKDKIFITAFNHSSGLLLLMDYLAYVYRGQSGPVAYFMVRLSNGMVFLLTISLVVLFNFYLSRQLFGSYAMSRNSDIPCRLRLRIAYFIGVTGVLLVIISQFTHWYYYFDANNCYVRGNLFLMSVAFTIIPFAIDLTIAIQYRKNVPLLHWICLLIVIVLPALAMVGQYFNYGVSLINVSIGFSFMLLFFDSNVALNQEAVQAKKDADQASKLEARTGISNEHGCIDFIAAIEPEKRKEYDCVMFDLKHFGAVNQRVGMQGGNQAIAEYVRIISAQLNEAELLARQGGDKFIAVVKRYHVNKLLELLANTQVTVKDSAGRDTELELSAFAGVYEIEGDATGADEIISLAEAALSYAKNTSKKDVEYLSDKMKKQIEDARALEDLIGLGLAHEEFLVYYQPKVNSTTSMLCGAEALVRWLHEGELISPGRFIPVMEKNDQVCELDFYMLKHVCRDLEGWVKKGLVPPTVSVNFSRRNLADPQCAARINAMIEEYHFPKKMIEIEITETNDEFPIVVLKNFIDELHRYGYRVAVDDFGCGSSSLSLLREVTFDTLKIDKGFVDRAYAKDLTILNYMIKLAKAIDLEVLAEGVEQREQVDVLQKLGCEIIQGYYYDKPLPKEQMEKRIKNKKYEGK